METIRSLHLQKNLGDVLALIEAAPVVLLNRGQPRAVIMTAAEFRRLTEAAGECVPDAALPRQPLTLRGGVPDDPLGYETADLMTTARTMAANALSGRHRQEVQRELSRVRTRLGRR